MPNISAADLSPWREKGGVQGRLSSSVNGQSCLGASKVSRYPARVNMVYLREGKRK